MLHLLKLILWLLLSITGVTSSKDFKEDLECLEIKGVLWLVNLNGGSIIRLDQQNQMSLGV